MSQEEKENETEKPPEPDTSWFHTGDEAEDFADQKAEEAAANRDFVYRFWMPKGAEQHITFVDPDVHPGGFKLPFVFMEHQLFLNNSWKNWFTCLGKTCPLCKGGEKPYLAAAYTIIDHNEWKDRNGAVHKDEQKLFIAKSKVYKVLQKARAKKKGLRGWKVEVTRTDDKSPNTGDQFDFEDRTDLPEAAQPPDYRELFKPKTVEELMAVVGDVQVENEDTVRF